MFNERKIEKNNLYITKQNESEKIAEIHSLLGRRDQLLSCMMEPYSSLLSVLACYFLFNRIYFPLINVNATTYIDVRDEIQGSIDYSVKHLGVQPLAAYNILGKSHDPYDIQLVKYIRYNIVPTVEKMVKCGGVNGYGIKDFSKLAIIDLYIALVSGMSRCNEELGLLNLCIPALRFIGVENVARLIKLTALAGVPAFSHLAINPLLTHTYKRYYEEKQVYYHQLQNSEANESDQLIENLKIHNQKLASMAVRGRDIARVFFLVLCMISMCLLWIDSDFSVQILSFAMSVLKIAMSNIVGDMKDKYQAYCVNSELNKLEQYLVSSIPNILTIELSKYESGCLESSFILLKVVDSKIGTNHTACQTLEKIFKPCGMKFIAVHKGIITLAGDSCISRYSSAELHKKIDQAFLRYKQTKLFSQQIYALAEVMQTTVLSMKEWDNDAMRVVRFSIYVPGEFQQEIGLILNKLFPTSKIEFDNTHLYLTGFLPSTPEKLKEVIVKVKSMVEKFAPQSIGLPATVLRINSVNDVTPQHVQVKRLAKAKEQITKATPTPVFAPEIILWRNRKYNIQDPTCKLRPLKGAYFPKNVAFAIFLLNEKNCKKGGISKEMLKRFKEKAELGKIAASKVNNEGFLPSKYGIKLKILGFFGDARIYGRKEEGTTLSGKKVSVYVLDEGTAHAH